MKGHHFCFIDFPPAPPHASVAHSLQKTDSPSPLLFPWAYILAQLSFTIVIIGSGLSCTYATPKSHTRAPRLRSFHASHCPQFNPRFENQRRIKIVFGFVSALWAAWKGWEDGYKAVSRRTQGKVWINSPRRWPSSPFCCHNLCHHTAQRWWCSRSRPQNTLATSLPQILCAREYLPSPLASLGVRLFHYHDHPCHPSLSSVL
jgi:hypothetical protein